MKKLGVLFHGVQLCQLSPQVGLSRYVIHRLNYAITQFLSVCSHARLTLSFKNGYGHYFSTLQLIHTHVHSNLLVTPRKANVILSDTFKFNLLASHGVERIFCLHQAYDHNFFSLYVEQPSSITRIQLS